MQSVFAWLTDNNFDYPFIDYWFIDPIWLQPKSCEKLGVILLITQVIVIKQQM